MGGEKFVLRIESKTLRFSQDCQFAAVSRSCLLGGIVRVRKGDNPWLVISVNSIGVSSETGHYEWRWFVDMTWRQRRSHDYKSIPSLFFSELNLVQARVT